MSNGVRELQKYTTVSKYARWVEELGRREVWGETVNRYQDMLLQKYPERSSHILEDCKSIESFEVLPSMRGLQFGGKPIFKQEARLYNCTSSYLDRLRFFAEAFYLLLCGCGTGFSVQDCHISHLPKFSKKRRGGQKLPKKTFVIPDTIEGWADCANVMMSAYHEEPVIGWEDWHECEPVFDYSGIREQGAKVSYGIGRAPGPIPLRKASLKVKEFLDNAILSGLQKMDSLTAYDITMHYSDAVISGGIRRSATISLFDLWDTKMRDCKTGNWRQVNPQRGRSNNSAILIRNRIKEEEFLKLFKATKEYGEPGFYFTDNEFVIPNPCVEIALVPLLIQQSEQPIPKEYQGPIYNLPDGSKALSGWQMCNLVTINGKTVRNKEDFLKRCEIGSRIGTWQAGFTSFPYLGSVTEEIVKREALLGVSIAGVMHNPHILLDPATLQAGAKIVLDTNAVEARNIGINPCARATCIKPDGNSASALGSFSGCHPGKFRKGMRLVQANKGEVPYQLFKKKNPLACEPSVWSTNGTDDVIRFCAEFEGIMEEDLSAVEFLGHVRTLYENWVMPGKVVERCTEPTASHNVSNTVRVRPEEWDEVAKDIFENRWKHSGVSFISSFGDRDYPQAPFTSVYNETEQIKLYGVNGVTQAAPLLNEALELFPSLWEACDFLVGNQTPECNQLSGLQHAWKEDAVAVAQKAFEGNVLRVTHALKDKYNWGLYKKLKEAYMDVDYSEMVEVDGSADFREEISCVGGACDL